MITLLFVIYAIGFAFALGDKEYGKPIELVDVLYALVWPARFINWVIDKINKR